MYFDAEDYYILDQPNFPFDKTLRVTAKVVSRWSRYYYARLLDAKKVIREKERTGVLPDPPKEKQKYIDDLISWILQNSVSSKKFRLLLDSQPVDKKWDYEKQRPKFVYFEPVRWVPVSWTLNLTEQSKRDKVETKQ